MENQRADNDARVQDVFVARPHRPLEQDGEQCLSFQDRRRTILGFWSRQKMVVVSIFYEKPVRESVLGSRRDRSGSVQRQKGKTETQD